jgi:hypothetical protein
MMNGLRVNRLELDELWGYVGRKRRQHEKPIPGDPRGDQYTYVALASPTRAIIAYRTVKRDSATTDDFIQNLRSRVIGTPEISTEGYHPYKTAIRDAFGNRVAHGTISKTYFRNASCGNRSIAALQPCRRNRCRAGRSKRRACGDLDQLCRAIAPDHADAMPPLRSFDERLQQDATEPRRSREPAYCVLQSVPGARSPADHPGCRAWHHRSHLVR